MNTSYQAHINNAEGKYEIKFETYNYNSFKIVEKACQKAVDKSDIFHSNCYLRDGSRSSEIEKTIEILKMARFQIKQEYIKEYSEAFEIALVALLKQIPQKTFRNPSDFSISCYSCRKDNAIHQASRNIFHIIVLIVDRL